MYSGTFFLSKGFVLLEVFFLLFCRSPLQIRAQSPKSSSATPMQSQPLSSSSRRKRRLSQHNNDLDGSVSSKKNMIITPDITVIGDSNDTNEITENDYDSSQDEVSFPGGDYSGYEGLAAAMAAQQAAATAAFAGRKTATALNPLAVGEDGAQGRAIFLLP